MATLYYNQVGIIDRYGVGKHALDKAVDALRVRYNKLLLQGQRLVRRAQPRGGTYTESTFGTNIELPRQNEDSDRLPFVTPIPGYKGSVTVTNYRLAMQVERSYTEDDLKGVVRQEMSGLLNSGRRLIEYSIADHWNNLTSASSPYAGLDGVAIASASHPHYRSESGTWSNVETSAALTSTTWSTARKNLHKRTEEFGYPLALTPALLISCVENEQKMRELKIAEKVPENATNQPWVFAKDKWDYMVYDYQTSTTAWGLLADLPEEYRGWAYAETVAPNIASLEGADLSTDIIWGQRLRMRFGILAVDGIGLQYNAGA